MSNFDVESVVSVDGESRVRVGPEIINGDGTVWLTTSPHGALTNAQAHHAAAMLVEATDYAAAVQEEARSPVQWPPGVTPDADWPPGSVHRFEWTDPAWRTARQSATIRKTGAAPVDDLVAFLRAMHAEDEQRARAARDFSYARCGIWEARGPYPAASGEGDGISRPRGNIRAEIGREDLFLDAELPWDLVPHMARQDPARTLLRVQADQALIEDLLAERHYVNDGDCWYTCRAATVERDGGETCNDAERGKPCDCGRDTRVERRLRILAQPYAAHPDYQEDWAK